MNKIISLTFLLIAFGCLGLSLNSCGKAISNEAKSQEKMLCGGYTLQHELSDEDIALFRAVVGESAFSPLTVATQVVAGLNYRFWCKYESSDGNSPRHCFITIYKPLQGEPVISSIQDENGNPFSPSSVLE